VNTHLITESFHFTGRKLLGPMGRGGRCLAWSQLIGINGTYWKKYKYIYILHYMPFSPDPNDALKRTVSHNPYSPLL
jgi:hypothetical protein